MLEPAAVARFLQTHPDFFVDHAEVFAALTVPHPYQNRVVSLGERQVMTLRDQVRTLESRLTGLVQQAQRNEALNARLKRWCQQLLTAGTNARQPEMLVNTLKEQFDLPDAALRLWQHDDAAVDLAVRRYADALATPYCGHDASTAALATAVAWLQQAPASFALVALRRAPQTPALGLLVLGAPDRQRFALGMATDVLADIGKLASAALAT